MDVINRLCFWGHSHVRMGTSPSGQDEAQMKIFAESGQPFFIRGILNKERRMEFTVFCYESGIKIVDAEWSIYEPVDESMRSEIEAELLAKVSEKVYTPPASNYTPGEPWRSGAWAGHEDRDYAGVVGFSGQRKKAGRKGGKR